jgi:hypothetical protein
VTRIYSDEPPDDLAELTGGCDAGQELVAVVVPGQLHRYLMLERVLRGVELFPMCGEDREECGPQRGVEALPHGFPIISPIPGWTVAAPSPT